MRVTPTREHPMPDETAVWYLERLARELPTELADLAARSDGEGFRILAGQIDAARIHHAASHRLERDIAILRLGMLHGICGSSVARTPMPLAASPCGWHWPTRRTGTGSGFELNVAATLTLKDLEYGYTDADDGRPDFLVTIPVRQVGIECTSARLNSLRDGPVAWKVGAAAGTKVAKPYAGNSTALFIDVTGLVAVPGQGLLDLTLEAIREQFDTYVDRTSYGSFLVMATGVAMEAEPLRIGTRYFRRDGAAPAAPLVEFLDNHFPEADTTTPVTSLFPMAHP